MNIRSYKVIAVATAILIAVALTLQVYKPGKVEIELSDFSVPLYKDLNFKVRLKNGYESKIKVKVENLALNKTVREDTYYGSEASGTYYFTEKDGLGPYVLEVYEESGGLLASKYFSVKWGTLNISVEMPSVVEEYSKINITVFTYVTKGNEVVPIENTAVSVSIPKGWIWANPEQASKGFYTDINGKTNLVWQAPFTNETITLPVRVVASKGGFNPAKYTGNITVISKKE